MSGTRARSRSERTTEALRNAILDGTLAPGERLIEERLSDQYGVSRVPIREAIQRLIAEGLAVPLEGRGAAVAVTTPALAEELVEVRAVLEGLNARLAARRRGPAVVERLVEALAAGNAAAATGSTAELARLNGSYHALLAAAGENAVLADVMRPLRERTNLVFRRNSAERAVEDWREHAAVLAAVIDGDEELAALLAARHVHRAARARLAPTPP